MKKFPYYRITCNIYDGKPLSLCSCTDYINIMEFLTKGIPTAIIVVVGKKHKCIYDANGNRRYTVWLWGDEEQASNNANTEKILGEIEAEWNGFKELYDKYRSERRRHHKI